MRRHCLLLVVPLLLLSAVCRADEVVVQDDFDGVDLSPDWIVHMDLPPVAQGWTYSVAAGSLTVTDVIPDTTGAWSAVRLRRECDAPGGFSLRASLGWSTSSEPPTNHAMQETRVALLDSVGNSIAVACYYDCWRGYRGTRWAQAGSETQEDAPSSLPFDGWAAIRIERSAGVAEVYWDDQLLVSGADTSEVRAVELSFWHYCHLNGSFFGTGAFDSLIVTKPETSVESSSWGYIKSLHRE